MHIFSASKSSGDSPRFQRTGSQTSNDSGGKKSNKFSFGSLQKALNVSSQNIAVQNSPKQIV